MTHTHEESIHARLSSDAALVAMVGDRIYPDEVPDHDTPPPFVVFTTTDSEPADDLDGAVAMVRHTVTVDVLAETFSEEKAVAKAVKYRLHKYTGAPVLRAFWRGTTNLQYDDGYHHQLTFLVIATDPDFMAPIPDGAISVNGSLVTIGGSYLVF